MNSEQKENWTRKAKYNPKKKKLIYRKFDDIGSADIVMKYLCITLLPVCIKPKKHINPEPKSDILHTFMHF